MFSDLMLEIVYSSSMTPHAQEGLTFLILLIMNIFALSCINDSRGKQEVPNIK